MMDYKKFYYTEYAKQMKSKYRDIVMKSIKKTYTFYIDKLKQHPMIYLN